MTEKIAEVAKIDTYCRPVLNSTPKTTPRKNVSSITGTPIDAATVLPNAIHAKLWRTDKMGKPRKKQPQQSRGITEKRIPAKRSRTQRELGASCKSAMPLVSVRRRSGQSNAAAAIRI